MKTLKHRVHGRRWINAKEAAELLGKSLYTLQRWRSNGQGPRWGKNGHMVIYFLADIDSYLASTLIPVSRESSTVDPGWGIKSGGEG